MLTRIASSNSCQPLNRTLFGSCINAGYNVSEFKTSTPQSQQLAILIQAAQSKLNCSRFSNLMTCSIFLPGSKCPSARLPCKDTCRSFVSDCQDGSSDIEGLLTLFNRLCHLLPTDQCLPTSMAHSNTTTADNVTCHELNISQCEDAGYSHTSVSSAYQKILETSDVFNNSKDNSTLRKIICMEIAPPCDNKSNNTLLVPCKTTCEAAFNESKPKFKKIFKSIDYCSAFLKTDNVEGQYYCVLQEWPNTGYWPSDLWKRVSTAHGLANSPSPPTTKLSENNSTSLSTNQSSENITSTVPTTKASTNVSTPASTTQASVSGTTAVTKAKPSQSLAPTTHTSKPADNTSMPTTQASKPVNTSMPTSQASKPVTTSMPTTQASKPINTSMPTTQASKPVNTSMPTTQTSKPVNTSMPTTQASKPVNTSMPTTQASRPVNTSMPATQASRPVNTSMPTTQTAKPANTSMPTTQTSKPVSTTMPTTPTSKPVSTTMPTTQASKPVNTSLTTESKRTGKSETPKVQAHRSRKLSAGIIAGIVVAVIAGLVLFVLGVIFFRRYKRLRAQYTHSLMVNMDEL
ncbi:hypothetical protein ABFA07_007018 [Porites harrisoni]